MLVEASRKPDLCHGEIGKSGRELRRLFNVEYGTLEGAESPLVEVPSRKEMGETDGPGSRVGFYGRIVVRCPQRFQGRWR